MIKQVIGLPLNQLPSGITKGRNATPVSPCTSVTTVALPQLRHGGAGAIPFSFPRTAAERRARVTDRPFAGPPVFGS
jgi:hypothetical protein